MNKVDVIAIIVLLYAIGITVYVLSTPPSEDCDALPTICDQVLCHKEIELQQMPQIRERELAKIRAQYCDGNESSL